MRNMRISRVQFRPADSLSRSYHINLETLTGADTRKTRCTKLSWEIQQMSLAAEARQRPHEEMMDELKQEGLDGCHHDNFPQEPDAEKSNSEGPKDLSIKTKKLKQIPPPLNLMTKPDPVNNLKDFAAIATSPKSPLMQKNLPFRKRAYSFSGVNDAAVAITKQTLPPPTPTSSEGSSQEVPPSPSYLPVSSHSSPGPLQPSPRTLHPPDPMRPPAALPIHPVSLLDTSALLSPAPSSLGSSQEELCYSPNWSSAPSRALPWPMPSWHCFIAGSRVRVDQLHGGCWQLAEELAVSHSAWSPEWLLPLQLEAVHVIRDPNEIEGSPLRISLQFSYVALLRVARPWEGGVLAECDPNHPFYVQEKGWCTVYPELAVQQYGFRFLPLERGDIVLAPNKLPLISPDICERFKRFSFPPEENSVPAQNLHPPSSRMPPPPPSPHAHALPPEGLLSPPSSPTKKVLDALRPKRPMNAFMLFAKKYRLELIQRYPGKDNRAISVLLGEAWRSLPIPERDVYVQEARVMAQEQKRLHPDCWKRKRSHSTS